MFSTAASSSTAARALQSAGLIASSSKDTDSSMRDLTKSRSKDRDGGRKATSRIKAHRNRGVELYKVRGSQSAPATLEIKGASANSLGKVGRPRRGAVSSSVPTVVAAPSKLPRTPVKHSGAHGTVARWKEVVESRWNAEARFLNLDNLIEDPLVKKYALVPPGHGGSSKDAAVIFKLASQLKPDIQTLSMANNNLIGNHLVHLARYLPNILNVSLANNNFKSFSDLEFLSSTRPSRASSSSASRLQSLRELILTGNPLQSSAVNEEKFRSEVARRVPSLNLLDQQPLRAQIAFDAPSTALTQTDVASIKPKSTKFPEEMGPSFVTGVDQSLISGFLARFLAGSPQETITAYQDNALFSLSANTSIPVRARIEGLHRSLPNQTKLEWKIWHALGSRNLTKTYSSGQDNEKMLKTLYQGREGIAGVLGQLPGMKVETGPGKSVLDAFPVQLGTEMGLLVTVHGQFVEAGSEGVRSFDRVFMLAPATPGSIPAQNGWAVQILNDQLTIRALSNSDIWTPGPMTVLPSHNVSTKSRPSKHAANTNPNINIEQGLVTMPPPPSGSEIKLEHVPVEQRPLLNDFPPEHVALILQTMTRTRLTVPYAIDCLKGNGGNIEQAVRDAENVKGTLPREAFLL